MTVSQVVGSVFEAKAGVRGALLAPSPGNDVVAAALNLPWYKQSKNTLSTYLKSNAWGVVSYDEPKKVKKLSNIMARAFDASLFSRLPLPRPELHSWVKLFYNMQACGMQGHWANVNLSHMACMEARLITQGKELIIGLPVQKIPGGDLREKRACLMTVTYPILDALVEAGGFALLHDSTQAAVLPSGFMFITYATEQTFMIRWSMSSDQLDTNRVKTILLDMIACFAELKSPSMGYQSFSNYIRE